MKTQGFVSHPIIVRRVTILTQQTENVLLKLTTPIHCVLLRDLFGMKLLTLVMNAAIKNLFMIQLKKSVEFVTITKFLTSTPKNVP